MTHPDEVIRYLQAALKSAQEDNKHLRDRRKACSVNHDELHEAVNDAITNITSMHEEYQHHLAWAQQEQVLITEELRRLLEVLNKHVAS